MEAIPKYIQKLLKKTGMRNLEDILIYSKTRAGWRAWLEKYTGSFTDFLRLYNYAEKIRREKADWLYGIYRYMGDR
ncbi:MAG: hypothetical protein DRN05_04825 [Thermoplasmata archaeon]|nr:MAG: hypothetical protein DRN05_04825 [Thermoplasmata archaeon]